MHVVHIVPEMQEGGVERVIVDMCRELVQRGIACTVISRGGRLVAQIEAHGGHHITHDVCSKNVLTFFLRARRLRRILAELAPDLVHVHSRLPAWMLHAANRRLHLPVVTTVHGLNRPSPYSRIMTCAHRVICVSEAVRDHLRRHYGTSDNIMRVVYFGINTRAFDPDHFDMGFVERFRREYRLDGRFVVTSAGRLTPSKDYETFIRGVIAAREQAPNIVGVIVGGANGRHCAYERQLRQLVHTLGADDMIRFVGRQDAMAEICALSDVMVSCSSKPESFGRTLAEALAMNTPVVATAHGGALEIVRESVDGFLFPPHDAQALARCLDAVRRHPVFTGLRDGILQRFSLAQTMTGIQTVYREALESVGSLAASTGNPGPVAKNTSG